MRNYIIRRLFLMIPTMFLVTILVFLGVRFIPGNVIDIMVSEMQSESGLGIEETAELLRHELGLDVPIYVQYGRWMSHIIRGDLGESLWTERSINKEISRRILISMELALFALISGLIIAIPIGIYSAIRQDTWGDYLGRTFAILCISLPSFWVGTMVIVYPSIWWDWSPATAYIPFSNDPVGNIVQFIVPGIIMGMILSGTIMRMTRTMMLEVLRQDYVRTAWSKGLTERSVIMRHALKNALLPVVTIVGILIPVLIGGNVVLEQIFNLPGLGRYLISALTQRDYPIISALNLVIGTLILLANLVIDLVYAWLDPRLQFS